MKDKKVSTKLIISFSIVIALTILVGVAGVIGMVQINRGSVEMYESQSQPLADLGMAREYFQRLRVQLRDIVLASGNLEELAIIEADLINHERGFIKNMESYRQTINDPNIIELYDDIMFAFAAYQPNMQQIIASARVHAPPVQMLLMMDDLVVPTDFIMEALDYLAYARVRQAAHANDINRLLFNTLFIMIIAVISVAIAIALFLTKYISGLISNPLKEISSYANKVSTGEIGLVNVTVNAINVPSADEIGNLARTLEQSYIQLNEFERLKIKAQESERRLADENSALETLSRMKTEYLANMSHEIKTPLTVISGNIQRSVSIIKELGIEDETLDRSLVKAKDEIMRMARITETALRMAALQESREKMKPLDAAAIFTIGAEAYRSIIEKRGNALEITVKDSLPQISGNADALIQVLANLLTNAKNHTENGRIALHIGKKNGAFISVTVTDTGTGIPPELLPRIFERGVSGGGGTGMGLPICKDIIASHGGEIIICNREDGAGVVAVFTIPVY